MIVTEVMARENLQKLRFLTDEDIVELQSRRRGNPKRLLSVRLTEEAFKILAQEREYYGVGTPGDAIELVLREIREMRKGRKR